MVESDWIHHSCGLRHDPWAKCPAESQARESLTSLISKQRRLQNTAKPGDTHQVGTIFGVPILVDLTDTLPEDRFMIIDQSQLALQKTFNARVKGKVEKGDLVRACDNCGDAIVVRSADIARGWGRFCSKRCKAIYQVKHS